MFTFYDYSIIYFIAIITFLLPADYCSKNVVAYVFYVILIIMCVCLYVHTVLQVYDVKI